MNTATKTESTTVRLRPASYQKAERIVGLKKMRNESSATLVEVVSDAVDALPDPELCVTPARKSQNHKHGKN